MKAVPATRSNRLVTMTAAARIGAPFGIEGVRSIIPAARIAQNLSLHTDDTKPGPACLSARALPSLPRLAAFACLLVFVLDHADLPIAGDIGVVPG